MARRVRPAGGLTSLMGSDSEPDFGGIDDDFSIGVRRATTMKKSVSRPMSSQRANKPAPTTTSRPVSKNHTSRSPSRKVLVETTNANARHAAKPASKNFLSEDEDADSMDLLGSKPRLAPTHGQQPTSTKRSWSRSMSPEDRYEQSNARKRRDNTEPSEDNLPYSRKQRDAVDDSNKQTDDSASIQRQLGEMKRKYAKLEARHQDLLDVGVKSAERNYDKLRRQTEERAHSADLLIAELKAEVKDQTAAAAEAERLRRKLADSQAHAKELQGQIADLTNTVAKSDREIQSLSTKLEASRAAEVNGKVPGSAIKGANNNKNWTGQSELVHAARVKEDMYSDLTGLLVRGVEEGDEGPVFDCLQTGKNGTLHFKLGLQKTENSSRYEDMEFAYRPQLQGGRDAYLKGLLPEYLLDDIDFPRLDGPKFYNKIVKGLMEKRAAHH